MVHWEMWCLQSECSLKFKDKVRLLARSYVSSIMLRQLFSFFFLQVFSNIKEQYNRSSKMQNNI